MDREELAWAGGLFEGEGSFFLKPDQAVNRACASVTMYDLDVLERFQQALGIGKVRGPYGPYQPNRKPKYMWAINGFERVQATIAMLWPFLGERRKEKAAEVLELCHKAMAPRREYDGRSADKLAYNREYMREKRAGLKKEGD